MVQFINSRSGRFLGALFVATVFFVFHTAIAQTTVVRVIQVPNQPQAHIEKDLSDVKISLLDACPTKNELTTYYNGNIEAYKSAKLKAVQCIDGYQRATLLSAKIADIQTSLNEINQRISSLEKTSVYLNSLKDLNGLAFLAIPSGKVETKRHEYAKDIAMQCVTTNATGLKNTGVVGNLTSDGLSWFNTLPDSQSVLAETVKAENLVIVAKIKKEIEDKGKISTGTIIDIANKSAELQKLMAKDFIPITVADFQSNYAQLMKLAKPPVLTVNIGYNIDDRGEKILHEIPTAALRLLAKLRYGITGPLVDATLGLAGVVYPVTWLPEQKMLTELRATTTNHITRLKKLRDQFQDILGSLQKKLRDLEQNNYDCQ